MHTAISPATAPAGPAARVTARVAVAGATGYAGQELLRLLARHPATTLTLATSSGATPAASHTAPWFARCFTNCDAGVPSKLGAPHLP